MSNLVEIKGICHSGKIGKAHDLFISMCTSKGEFTRLYFALLTIELCHVFEFRIFRMFAAINVYLCVLSI